MAELKIDLNKKDYIKGENPNAEVELIEYGDYECPFSRVGYRFAQLVLKKHSNKVRFAFRNFPIRKKHPNAQMAAEAALCAGKQNMFWEMHDVLFDHGDQLSEDLIVDLAEKIGLDKYTFKVDLATEEFKLVVQNHFRSGVKHGVNDTPTFFINGEKYEGNLVYSELLKEIEAEFENS